MPNAPVPAAAGGMPKFNRSQIMRDAWAIYRNMTRTAHLAASSADCREGETAKVQPDMSDEELAATDFEPWDVNQCAWAPPTNEEWARLANPYLVNIRIAWVMLQKTKPELIGVVSNLEGQGMAESAFERLTETEDFLTGLLEVVKTAQARFICAALNIPGEAA